MEAGGEADMRRLWQLPDTGKGVITGERGRERYLLQMSSSKHSVISLGKLAWKEFAIDHNKALIQFHCISPIFQRTETLSGEFIFRPIYVKITDMGT